MMESEIQKMLKESNYWKDKVCEKSYWKCVMFQMRDNVKKHSQAASKQKNFR